MQQPAARTIYAPAAYREILLKIYAGLGVTASVAAPSAVVARESRTGIKVNDRGYGMIQFERIGQNVAIELSQAVRDVQGLGASSVQLSGPLGDPGLPLLTDAARTLGFFFCGLGPAFAEGADIFQLQLLSEPLEGIVRHMNPKGLCGLELRPSGDMVSFFCETCGGSAILTIMWMLYGAAPGEPEKRQARLDAMLDSLFGAAAAAH